MSSKVLRKKHLLPWNTVKNLNFKLHKLYWVFRTRRRGRSKVRRERKETTWRVVRLDKRKELILLTGKVGIPKFERQERQTSRETLCSGEELLRTGMKCRDDSPGRRFFERDRDIKYNQGGGGWTRQSLVDQEKEVPCKASNT